MGNSWLGLLWACTGEDFDVAQVGLQVITGRLPLATANDQWFVQSSYVVSVLPSQTLRNMHTAAEVLGINAAHDYSFCRGVGEPHRGMCLAKAKHNRPRPRLGGECLLVAAVGSLDHPCGMCATLMLQVP